MTIETATLGGGCFWCVEAVYERFEGIVDVRSGYAGGHVENPTYRDVCSGETGHAEVVQVDFDPTQITFDRVLEIFWQAHDPTTLNRQGADTGTQYRSIIMFHSDDQRRVAEASRERAQSKFTSPIVTEITPFTTFYEAEDYHQDFFRNNPGHGYCRVVIQPKLDKLGLDAGPPE